MEIPRYQPDVFDAGSASNSIDLFNEEDLILQAQHGDSESYEILYQAYYPQILYYVIGRVGDYHAAEDIVSEVFERAYRSLSNYRYVGNKYSTYLYQIAKHLIYDQHRASIRRPEIIPDYEMPEMTTAADAVESDVMQRMEVNAVLATLAEKPSWLEVIQQRYIDDMTVPAIAEQSGKTIGSVKAMIRRAEAEIASKMNI